MFSFAPLVARPENVSRITLIPDSYFELNLKFRISLIGLSNFHRQEQLLGRKIASVLLWNFEG